MGLDLRRDTTMGTGLCAGCVSSWAWERQCKPTTRDRSGEKKLPHTCGMQKYFDVNNSIDLSQASPPLQKNHPKMISRHIAPSLKIIRLSNYRQSNSFWPVSPCLPPCLGPASKVFHSKKRREKATTLAGRRRRRKQPWDFLAPFSHLLPYFFSAGELCFCFFCFCEVNSRALFCSILTWEIISFFFLGSLVSKDGRSVSESLCLHPIPLQGYVPKTLHLDLVIPPRGGFDPGPPSSQFWKRER